MEISSPTGRAKAAWRHGCVSRQTSDPGSTGRDVCSSCGPGTTGLRDSQGLQVSSTYVAWLSQISFWVHVTEALFQFSNKRCNRSFIPVQQQVKHAVWESKACQTCYPFFCPSSLKSTDGNPQAKTKTDAIIYIWCTCQLEIPIDMTKNLQFTLSTLCVWGRSRKSLLISMASMCCICTMSRNWQNAVVVCTCAANGQE